MLFVHKRGLVSSQPTISMKFTVFICCILILTPSSRSHEDCGKHKENDNNFPWNVGIYKESKDGQLEGVCLGSIVKPTFILTAAHCLCDHLDGKKLAAQFYVVPGKIEKTLSLKNKPPNIQKISPSNVEVYKEYSGLLGFFEFDIAVVRLDSKLVFNEQVGSICVDWGNNNPILEPNTIGKQVIWDKSSTKIADVTHIDKAKCETESQKLMWHSFLTHDKICAHSNDLVLGDDDGGSGLVFKNPDNGLWYLRAIYSLQDNKAHKINVYTRIGRFINWLISKTVVKKS